VLGTISDNSLEYLVFNEGLTTFLNNSCLKYLDYLKINIKSEESSPSLLYNLIRLKSKHFTKKINQKDFIFILTECFEYKFEVKEVDNLRKDINNIIEQTTTKLKLKKYVNNTYLNSYKEHVFLNLDKNDPNFQSLYSDVIVLYNGFVS